MAYTARAQLYLGYLYEILVDRCFDEFEAELSRYPYPIDLDASIPPHGGTLLIGACAAGGLSVVQMLLAKAVDVNKACNSGRTTPLLRAVEYGHSDIMIALLSAGADVNQASLDGWTPLIVAVANCPSDMVSVLLAAGADVDQADGERTTPLCRAAKFDIDIVRALLEAGATVDLTDDVGDTALICAVDSPNDTIDIVKALIAAGAAVHKTSPDFYNESIVHTAARANKPDVVAVLLNAGADVDAQDSHGDTALSEAVSLGLVAIVTQLLAANAVVDHAAGYTLWIAANNNHGDVASLLLTAGASVDGVHNGETALCNAVKKGHVNVVRVLLRAGASAAAVGLSGKSIMYSAMKSGHDEGLCIVELLVAYGATTYGRLPYRPEWMKPYLASPLALAWHTQRYHVELVQALKLGRVDPDTTHSAARALNAGVECLCSKTRSIVASAMLPWSPARHWLYHAQYRETVHTLALIEQRCRANPKHGFLPRELWWHVLQLCNRTSIGAV